MQWSTTETKRVAVCLFLSVLLHLAVVLLTPTMPDSQPALQVVFRLPPHTLETRIFDPMKPALHERQILQSLPRSARRVDAPLLGTDTGYAGGAYQQKTLDQPYTLAMGV